MVALRWVVYLIVIVSIPFLLKLYDESELPQNCGMLVLHKISSEARHLRVAAEHHASHRSNLIKTSNIISIIRGTAQTTRRLI